MKQSLEFYLLLFKVSFIAEAGQYLKAFSVEYNCLLYDSCRSVPPRGHVRCWKHASWMFWKYIRVFLGCFKWGDFIYSVVSISLEMVSKLFSSTRILNFLKFEKQHNFLIKKQTYFEFSYIWWTAYSTA